MIGSSDVHVLCVCLKADALTYLTPRLALQYYVGDGSSTYEWIPTDTLSSSHLANLPTKSGEPPNKKQRT